MQITDIDGVYASGIHCGIKSTGALDLAYIYVPNCVGSAIVQSQHHVRSVTLDHNDTVFTADPVKLMVINSGNANAVTGPIGAEHVAQTVAKAANHFGCLPSQVGVASTGIIGVPLPIDNVLRGIDQFSGDEKQGDACANAILTTDLIKKDASKTIKLHGQNIHIAGITKGSGMISPNMATTLGFIATNLALTSDQCKQVLTAAIEESYNMLSVDTDSSTNDLVTLQASGEVQLDLNDVDIQAVTNAVTDVCIDLAKQIAKDGEGASHFIEVNVSGAESKSAAKLVAKQVVDSPLVKTAIAGEDPNWGRIVMAVGKNPAVKIDSSQLGIIINGLTIFSAGRPKQLSRPDIQKAMAQPDVIIDITVGEGTSVATAWGCDLTHGYIDINTEYN